MDDGHDPIPADEKGDRGSCVDDAGDGGHMKLCADAVVVEGDSTFSCVVNDTGGDGRFSGVGEVTDSGLKDWSSNRTDSADGVKELVEGYENVLPIGGKYGNGDNEDGKVGDSKPKVSSNSCRVLCCFRRCCFVKNCGVRPRLPFTVDDGICVSGFLRLLIGFPMVSKSCLIVFVSSNSTGTFTK